MQISQKERLVFTTNKFKEVANVIAAKIVHPVTNRPFPVEVIEEAMRNIRFKAKMNDDTKKQAVSCIRQLIFHYNVIRAKMQIILSCEVGEDASVVEIVKEKSDEALAENKKWFISYKELPIDGAGRFQIEVVAEPSKFRDISEWIANDINSGALEIVEEAIVNNTIGDIDEVNIMEERVREPEENDEEEEEEPEVKIGAVREIAEMEIDRDLMASMKGGIQASKKKRKKKKNRKKKQDAWEGTEIKEENPDGTVTEGGEDESIISENLGIQAAPKKKKKKKKKRNNAAYNLGSEPQQRKQKKHEQKEYEFSEVPEEFLEMLQEEEFDYYCSSCPFGTEEMDDYKGHFKSDWHRFNVTRKAKGLFQVMEDQFKEYTVLKEFIQ